MVTESEILKWARGYRRDMNGLCQAFMWQITNRFGKPASPSPLSATAARKRSVVISDDPRDAPAGSFHYWSGVSKRNDPGHVALGLGGDRCLMASARVSTMIGDNTGIVSISGYTRETGLNYEGWSHTNANGDVTLTVATINTASTSKTPVQPPTVQEDDMAYIAPILEEKNGKIVETGQGYSGPGGFYFIENEDHRKLLERDIEATRKSARGERVDAQFLEGERIIVDGYKSGTRPRK